MREILLTQGKVALVDDEDFDKVDSFKWYASRQNGGKWYAQRGTAFDRGTAISQTVGPVEVTEKTQPKLSQPPEKSVDVGQLLDNNMSTDNLSVEISSTSQHVEIPHTAYVSVGQVQPSVGQVQRPTQPTDYYHPGQRRIPPWEFDPRRVPLCPECRRVICDYYEHWEQGKIQYVDIEGFCSDECNDESLSNEVWEAQDQQEKQQ